jgi:hypothetical protein
MRFRVLGFVLGLCFVCTLAEAQVPLRIEQEGSSLIACTPGHMTEIVVEGGVSHLVRSGSSEALEVEHAPGRVFVTPRRCDNSELVIIDRGGRSFRIRFSSSELSLEQQVFSGERIYISRDTAAVSFRQDHALGMLKAMVLGQKPSGATESSDSELLWQDKTMRLTVIRSYTTAQLKGWVVRAENLLGRALVIPLQRLSLPGLLLGTVERDILQARGRKSDSTTLYLVLRR